MAETLGHLESHKDAPGRAVTTRSVVVSIVVIAVSVLWNEWLAYYISGSNISKSHFPMALFFPFFTVCTLNWILHHVGSGWVLTRSELLVILGSGFIGISVSFDSVTAHFFGVLASPDYFDSVENGWALYLHDNIPAWLAPSNATGEMTRFFEGGSGSPQWRVWATPLFWWTSLFAGLGFSVFCVVVILRKQWVDHERLSYPLVEVAKTLTETEKDGKLAQTLRSPLFWIAFAIVMTLKLWNIGSYFTPAFPHISMEGGTWLPFPDFPAMITRFSFYAVGFGFFSPLDVLFSVWFFVLLTAFQIYVFNISGYPIGAATTGWTSDAVSWQSMGALIFLAGLGLWMARAHIKAVFRKAFYSDCEVDDSQELLSYRAAVFGFIGSLMFVSAWLCHAGISLWVVFVFLPVALLLFLGLSRAVAELGLVYVYYRIQPHHAVIQAFGANLIGIPGVVILGFMNVFNHTLITGKGYLMPPFTQAVKAVDKVVSPRRITAVLWLALALGFAISVVNTLYLSYEYGAYNLGKPFKSWGPQTFNFVLAQVRNPKPPGGDGRVMWAMIGIGLMAILTMIRYWVPKWPLHPIGLAVQGNYGVCKTAFSIMIAWGMKAVVMKMGGVRMYEKGKPFFIGLLVAQAVSTWLVFTIDWFWFPMQGHNVHNY